jgi:hypothetical protein
LQTQPLLNLGTKATQEHTSAGSNMRRLLLSFTKVG